MRSAFGVFSIRQLVAVACLMAMLHLHTTSRSNPSSNATPPSCSWWVLSKGAPEVM